MFGLTILLDLSTQTHKEPEYVDHQFQCDPLDVVVEVVLPRSPPSALLTDVRTACMVALMQVKMYLQGLTPAKTNSYYKPIETLSYLWPSLIQISIRLNHL